MKKNVNRNQPNNDFGLPFATFHKFTDNFSINLVNRMTSNKTLYVQQWELTVTSCHKEVDRVKTALAL